MALYPDYGTPGYPNLDPYYVSPEEEAAMERESLDQRDNFREALEACIADNRADLYLSQLWDIARDVLLNAKRTPGEPEWQTNLERWPDANKAQEMLRALEAAYTALAFAFSRIHALPRTRDTELAADIAKVRARIERLIAKATTQ